MKKSIQNRVRAVDPEQIGGRMFAEVFGKEEAAEEQGQGFVMLVMKSLSRGAALSQTAIPPGV